MIPGNLCTPEKPTAPLDLKGVSGSRRMALPLSDWLPALATLNVCTVPPPKLRHIFSTSSGAHSTLGSPRARGRGWRHCAPDCPSHSPPSSSYQQIQLANLMLQLQKAKQLWTTDQVPWNSLSWRGLGGLQTAEQYGKSLPTQRHNRTTWELRKVQSLPQYRYTG